MLNLKKLSKKALEAIGRDKGIELDRRLKKDKLIEQLQEALESEVVEETTSVEVDEQVVEETTIEGWDYTNNCWDRNHPVGHKKYWENFRKRH